MAVFGGEKPVNGPNAVACMYLARLLLMFIEYRRFVPNKSGDFREQLMSKMSSIVDFLEVGIRAESLRQKAIANNIANLETPGYRRIDVKFQEMLAKALNSPGEVELDEVAPLIHQPKQTSVNSNGNDVNLEAEIGQMVKNTIRYKAYIRLLNKKYKQIELAMGVK